MAEPSTTMRFDFGLPRFDEPEPAPGSVVGIGSRTPDPDIDKIIGIESGGKATAKNPRSSATGSGQFIESTWLETVSKYRPDLLQGRTRKQVLDLRKDGDLSKEMTGYYTQENVAALRKQGLPVLPETKYLSHFLGAGGAASVLRARPGTALADVLPAGVIKANPHLKGKSNTWVIDWARRKMAGQEGGTGGEAAVTPARKMFQELEAKEPGRYKIIKKADYENWRKEWEANQPGTFGTAWQGIKEWHKGLLRGAAKVGGGTALQGISGFETILDQKSHETLAKHREQLARLPDMSEAEASDWLAGLNKPSSQGGADLLERYFLSQAVQDIRAGRLTAEDIADLPAPKATKDRHLYQKGEEVKQWAEDTFGADPAWQDGITAQLSEGVGSFLAGLPAAVASPAAGAAFFTTLGVGEATDRAVAYQQKMQQAVEKARTEGLPEAEIAALEAKTPDEKQVALSALYGIAPGATDLIPAETLLYSLKVPRAAHKPLLKVIGRIGGQAFIEGIQEGGQGVLQNWIAQGVYNPEQDLIEGVAPEAATGAGVGGIVQTGVEVLKALMPGRQRGTGQADQPPVDQPAQPAAQPAAPAGPLTGALQSGGIEPTVAPGQFAQIFNEDGSALPVQVQGIDGEWATVTDEAGESYEVPVETLTPLATDPEIVQGGQAALPGPEPRLGLPAPALRMPDATSDPAIAMPETGGQKAARVLRDERAGTREAPVAVETPEDVAAAEAQVNPEPTEGQKEAGNYQKGHLKLAGLNISIENPKGSERSGTGQDGTPWSVTMPAAYGYVKGTEGKDGDQVDIYIGDNPTSERVFVVDQVDAETGAFDEHKAMLGFGTEDGARAAYEAAFSDGKGAERIGALTELPVGEFKDWLGKGKRNRPVGALEAEKQAQNIPQNIPEPAAPAPVTADDLEIPSFLDRRKQKAVEGTDATETENQPDLSTEAEPLKTVEQDMEAARPAFDEFVAGKKPIRLLRKTLGVSEGVASRLTSQAVKDGRLVQAKNGYLRTADRDARKARLDAGQAKKKPVTTMLKALGGIDPDSSLAGDLRSMGITAQNAPGLFKKGGRGDIDNIPASEHALFVNDGDARGYIKPDMLKEALVGEVLNKKPRLSQEDQDTEDTKDIEADNARAREEIEAAMAEADVAGDEAVSERALSLYAQGNIIPELAVETAMIQLGEEATSDPDDARFAQEDIPFGEPDAGPVAEAVESLPERRYAGGGEQAGAATAVQDGETPARGGEAESEAPRQGGKEPKARQPEQAELAGTGPISDAELAQRRADQRLKAKADQQPADQGLFSDDSKQTDLVDMARAARKAEGAKAEKAAPKPKPKPEKAPAKSSKPAETDAKIEDFGEKIEGARKDTFTGFRDSLKDELDVATEPLSKSFPLPNYEKLAAAGVSKRALALIAVMRDTIPNRPRQAWKAKRWAEQVGTLRTFAGKILEGKTDLADVESRLKESPLLRDIVLTADAIEDVAPADLPKAAQYRVSSGSYSMLNGKRYDPSKSFWFMEGPKRRSVRNPFSNDPSLYGTYRETPEEAVALAKEIIAHDLARAKETGTDQARSKFTNVGVYRDRKGDGTFLGFKVRSTVIRLKAGFETPKAAREYLEENREEIQATIDEMRKGPNMRGTENRPRSGASLREGDVTPEIFSDTFGFRGVQFGNYVEGGRRQADLNRAFDALMDLADVLDVPTRALSLNGQLGLAFGARGRGGKNAAAAHYEPDQIVINLTKNAGPGSLAHEWLHALDSYFARQDEASGYISERQRDQGPVRDEVYQAWKQVEASLKKGPFADRSAKFDETRSKPYWGTTIEKAARSFERYIVDRLAEKGAVNDYLANIDLEGGAYPTEKEMQSDGIRAAYDQLFDVIEARETDQGIELASSAPRLKIDDAAQADLKKQITALVRKFVGSNYPIELQETIPEQSTDAYRADTDAAVQIMGGRPKTVGGSARIYSNGAALIRIATRDPGFDPLDTAVHEPYHVAAALLQTDAERALIQKHMPRIRSLAADHLVARGFDKERAKQVTDALPGYEAEAIAAEGYVRLRDSGLPISKTRLPRAVAMIFERFRRLIAGVRDVLSRNGYKRWEDIYEDFYQGRMADREPAASPRKFSDMASSVPRPYASVPDSLMGFRKEGPQKGFDETKYPHVQDVRVTFPGREPFEDAIKGMNKEHALERARRNWKGAEIEAADGAETVASSIPSDALARDTAQDRQDQMGRDFGTEPLDRLIRIPFDIFGGTNNKGEWEPGLKLSEKAAEIITSAKFDEGSRFAFMNPILHKGRAGVIDRYGLDPAYVERERQRGLDERRITAQIPELMQTLKDANIGPEEAKALQAILTGEALPDAEWAKISEPIRNAIDQLGQDAVELGLLSAESYERNQGSYLHRVYLKHENDQSGLARMANRIMGSRRQKILGEQFKGRGQWVMMPFHNLQRQIKGLTFPENGEKFRIVKVTSPGRDGEPGTSRRVFLREGDPIPDSGVDLGLYETRGRRGGAVVLWRDWTKEEREQMGEIVDARYTIAKTYMLMANDLATGKFFRDISENKDWTWSESTAPNNWTDAAEYRLKWNEDNPYDWVRVPDVLIPKSQTKRYGALAGKFVRAEIWRDLSELDKMQRDNLWTALLKQWKLNKTARSPVVHMNNIMSNVLLMDMAGVGMADLVQGLRGMLNQDANYQEAVDAGAFGADMISVEMRENVLRPLLEEIEADMVGKADDIQGKTRSMGKLANAIWGAGLKFDRKMRSLYQMEDEVFRMATYIRRRRQGASPVEAALEARDQFLNYDIRAPWINAARRTVLPFLSYTYRAAPIVARTVMTRPWKIAKYATLAYGLNALAYSIFPGDEDEERRSMREGEQGYVWIGAPRMLRMPFGDSYGNPVFLDIRRWIPAGDVFDMTQGHSAFNIPAPLQFGGPLMLGAELMLNKQAFTGKEIVNDLTDDWWDKSSKIGDWAWKSWMPSAAYIPGSWYWQRVSNAASGVRDWSGRPYDLPQAISSSVGVKLKPQDVREGFAIHGREFEKVERDLKTQMSRLGRDRSRGAISASAFERERTRLIEKMQTLTGKAQETFKTK
jgi:inorganic pyrophosphatase-like protein/conjugative element/phage-associated large polyvalent protein